MAIQVRGQARVERGTRVTSQSISFRSRSGGRNVVRRGGSNESQQQQQPTQPVPENAVASAVGPQGQAGFLVNEPISQDRRISALAARSPDFVASTRRSPNEFITSTGGRSVPVASTREGFVSREVMAPTARAETTTERRSRQSPAFAAIQSFREARSSGAGVRESIGAGVNTFQTSRPIGARQDATIGFAGPGFFNSQTRERISRFGTGIRTGLPDERTLPPGFFRSSEQFSRNFVGGNLERFGASPRRSTLEFGAGGLAGRGYQGVRNTVIAQSGAQFSRFGAQRGGEFLARGAIGAGETVIAVEGIRRSRGDINAFGAAGFGAGVSQGAFFGPTPVTQGVNIRNPFDTISAKAFREPSTINVRGTTTRSIVRGRRQLSTRLGEETTVSGLPATFNVPGGLRRDVVGLPNPRAVFARRFGPRREPVTTDLGFVGARGFVDRTSIVPQRPGSPVLTTTTVPRIRSGLNPGTGQIEFEVGGGGQVLLMRQEFSPVSRQSGESIFAVSRTQRRAELFGRQETTAIGRTRDSGLSSSRRLSGISAGLSGRTTRSPVVDVGFASGGFVSTGRASRFSVSSLFGTGLGFRQGQPSRQSFSFANVQQQVVTPRQPSLFRSVAPAAFFGVARGLSRIGDGFGPIFGGGRGRGNRPTVRRTRQQSVYAASLTGLGLGVRARDRRASGFTGIELRGI